MKKTFFSLIFLFVVLFNFTACFSVPVKIYTSNNELNTNYLANDIQVSITPISVTNLGYNGFNIIISNNTENPILVNFAKSSISYLNTTNTPFVTGMKFVDAGTVPPAKNIPSGLITRFELYSPEQTSFNSTTNWNVNPICIVDNSPITILLCLEINEKTYYWTSSITYNAN